MTSLPPKIDTKPGRLEPASISSRVSEAELKEILQKIWRRRRIIFGTVLTMLVLAGLVTWQLTPIYTSSALVLVEPRQSQVVNIAQVLSGLPADAETVNSEIQVIKSRHLARRVVEKMKLELDPEFNPTLRQPTLVTTTLGAIQSIFHRVGGTASDPEVAAERERAAVVDNLRSRIKATNDSSSRVIDVSVGSESPVKARAILQTLTDLYLVDQLDVKFEATQRAAAWLNDRLSEVTRKVEISERAVEDFRRENGLIQGKDQVNLTTGQITELSSQLVVARTKVAEAEARLKQVQAVARSGSGADAVGEVLQSPLIQALRQQEAGVLRKQAELATKYGPKHPQMINVNAELADLRQKITIEVRNIIANLRTELEVAKAREASLGRDLSSMEQRVGGLNEKEVQLRALEREATANRTLLNTFLQRFKETSGQEGIQAPDSRIISAASLPTGASFPNVPLIMSLTLVSALILGVGLVFAIEQLDSGFRSMDQVEREMGVPALGMIPLLDTAKSGGLPPEQYCLEKPVSAYAESIRNLYVSLSLSDVDKPPKLVLITSSVPEEGKSAVSLSLSRVVARSGQKVALIDCDLRRPAIHSRLNLPAKPGLVELLAHRAQFKDIVRVDKESGAHIIPAGELAPNPTDLLGSEQMQKLLADLSKVYDFVVLDCSPVLAVTDARVLARRVDKVVYVVQWEQSRRETAAFGLKQLQDAGGSVAGVLLTKVNVKKHAGYSYADSGYYHGRYQKYYTE
ncbi:MAG: GumC family protein [Candidatus Eiseniibacteriota bacterium]